MSDRIVPVTNATHEQSAVTQTWNIEQVRAECGLAHSAGITEGRRMERAAVMPLLRRALALAERAAARTTGMRGDPGPNYDDRPWRDDFDNDDQHEEDIDELSRLADMAERGEHEKGEGK